MMRIDPPSGSRPSPGGHPVFLRTPGVLPSREVKELLLSRDPYARQALEMLDSVDLALMGIGACEANTGCRPWDNVFPDEELARMRDLGAVGEVCLHFLDAEGSPIASGLEDLLVGITLDQLRNARHRWAVAGGSRKHHAIRAALTGGWVDILVTDASEFLLSGPAPASRGNASTIEDRSEEFGLLVSLDEGGSASGRRASECLAFGLIAIRALMLAQVPVPSSPS